MGSGMCWDFSQARCRPKIPFPALPFTGNEWKRLEQEGKFHVQKVNDYG
jgi:hypothetical protein